MPLMMLIKTGFASPSSRRAWIEMLPRLPSIKERRVALLAEGGEKNKASPPLGVVRGGALPAGGGGRN